MFKLAISALSLSALFAAGSTFAQPAGPPPAAPPATPPAAAAPAPNDYGDKANWLCWPGRADACASDLTATVIKADGSTAVQPFQADPNAPVDCFYVYPTVSTEPGVISDMTVQPSETNVVIQQAARLTAKCRLYAPMYRQFTLTALASMMMGKPLAGMAGAGRQTGYNDVKDAWNYYLAHENHGRGVVLVGHSQGSGVLTQLIKNEIDGKPSQAKIVSAILMGTALVVPEGKDVGGDFQSIPLCHSASQTGCVIAYSSFREATLPPPDNTRFGVPRNGAAGMEAACVNPASLGGGTAEAISYFKPGGSNIAGQAEQFPWLKGTTITTPYLTTPGLITAECVHSGRFHVLAIHVNADPAGPRTSTIPGDVVLGGVIQKDWGLHLIDANLFMGNLVDIVGEESKAWAAKK